MEPDTGDGIACHNARSTRWNSLSQTLSVNHHLSVSCFSREYSLLNTVSDCVGTQCYAVFVTTYEIWIISRFYVKTDFSVLRVWVNSTYLSCAVLNQLVSKQKYLWSFCLTTIGCHFCQVVYHINRALSANCQHAWHSSSVKWPTLVVR